MNKLIISSKINNINNKRIASHGYIFSKQSLITENLLV